MKNLFCRYTRLFFDKDAFMATNGAIFLSLLVFIALSLIVGFWVAIKFFAMTMLVIAILVVLGYGAVAVAKWLDSQYDKCNPQDEE